MRCTLLQDFRDKSILKGTPGEILNVEPDGRLKVIFDGQYNADLVPARMVRRDIFRPVEVRHG